MGLRPNVQEVVQEKFRRQNKIGVFYTQAFFIGFLLFFYLISEYAETGTPFK